MNSKRITIGLALVLIAIGGLSCARYILPERYASTNPRRVAVDLPRNVNTAETDPTINKSTAVIVNLNGSDEIFVGEERTSTPRQELGSRLHQLLQNVAGSDKMVYVAASPVSDYGAVVEILDAIRKQDVEHVGLVVRKERGNAPSQLPVEIAATPDPNEDISNLKPNPLMLLVTISPDLRLTLNAEAVGSVNDTAPLSAMLQGIFQQRKENYALRPGFETRTDLPIDERVEKTLIIKPGKAVKYGDVVKIIDAVRGAGARPIGLQIDDLPQ